MAMALYGKNRHYHRYNIQPLHFQSTAKHSGLNLKIADKITDELLDTVDEAISSVTGILPDNFPDLIASSIFTGIRNQRDRFASNKFNTK